LKRGFSRCGAHLAPGFLNYPEKLLPRVVRVLGSEIRDLILEENKTGAIFQQLGVRIRLQSRFGNPNGRVLSLTRLDTSSQQQFASEFGLFAVKTFSPGEVPGSICRVRIPGNTPALDVLAPRRQAKQLVSARCEAKEPSLHPVGIDEFCRPPVHCLGVRRMSCIDELTRDAIGIHGEMLQLKSAASQSSSTPRAISLSVESCRRLAAALNIPSGGTAEILAEAASHHQYADVHLASLQCPGTRREAMDVRQSLVGKHALFSRWLFRTVGIWKAALIEDFLTADK
jgi:hypothetical protein